MKKIATIALTAFMLSFSYYCECEAEDARTSNAEIGSIEAEKKIEYEARAKEKAQKDAEKTIVRQWQEEDALREDRIAKERRYFSISQDKDFTYYMDTSNIHWKRCPYKADEYIIDVWIRLVDNRDITKLREGKIESIDKYYMEHYYLRPETKQIQFMCELEVSSGGPQNNIRQRSYSPAAWEDLVPGSIEDNVYHGVIRNIKKYNLIKDKNGRDSSSILDSFHRVTSSVAEGLGVYI